MQDKKLKAVILRNEDPYDHLLWEKACLDFSDQVTYRVVDVTKNDWLESIKKEPVDYILSKPGGKTSAFKQLYDERLRILSQEMNIPCFPSLDEVLIYENKKYFAYWLAAHQLPHPATHVFYDLVEAQAFLKKTAFPLVAKLNIGASGNGVQILHNVHEASKYVEALFLNGKSPKTGPKLSKGRILQRLWNKVKKPGEFMNRLKTYRSIAKDIQKDYVILQEYVPHQFEWRVVRIGNSFFAHKKLVDDQKASGSLIKKYETPPLSLLSFVKEITDRFHFYSMAVDLFEPEIGHFLINEMQCIFGQSDPYQMLVDGEPGRYVSRNGKWFFEEGDFNKNESYNLRVKYLIYYAWEKLT